MKKFLCIFLLLTLFACADSMDYSYKFKDLTINIPVDVVLESKAITGDYTDLRGDDYVITMQKLHNKNNLSFYDLRKQYESIAIFESGCTLITNDNSHAVYKYGDCGLACIYMGNDNSYYSLIAQGEKEALKTNYNWILKAFKNIKV